MLILAEAGRGLILGVIFGLVAYGLAVARMKRDTFEWSDLNPFACKLGVAVGGLIFGCLILGNLIGKLMRHL